MDVVHRRRIIVFVNVAADAIDHGGEKRIEALRPRQKTRCRFARERLQRLDGSIDCRLTASTNSTPDEIQKRAFGFMNHIRRKIFKTTRNDIGCQGFRFRHGVEILATKRHKIHKRYSFCASCAFLWLFPF